MEKQPRLSAFQLYGSYSDTMIETLMVVVPDMAEFWKGFDASAWSAKNEVLMFWEYEKAVRNKRG